MRPQRIEHVGIAVKNLEASIAIYEVLLGTPCYAVEEVADQMARTAFFRIGETKIELLESTSADGPIGKFIEKRGEGIHHIAFVVDDVAASLSELERHDVQVIDRRPRRGAEGLDIAFLHPRSTNGVLVELCSHPNGEKSSVGTGG